MKDFKEIPVELNHNVLKQPKFNIQPAAMKIKDTENYLQLMREQYRNQEAISLLEKAAFEPSEFRRLTDDANKIFDLVEELDAGQNNYDFAIGSKWGTIEKLRKTSTAMDDMINGQF